jgi:large subunit ribosomal protein L30
MVKTKKKLKVTLKRGAGHRLRKHQACVIGLGLRKIHHSVVVEDTRENRGMINKISYLLAVEET